MEQFSFYNVDDKDHSWKDNLLRLTQGETDNLNTSRPNLFNKWNQYLTFQNIKD